MDFRERCYEAFVSKHWRFSLSLSNREFEHLRKVYRKRFKKFLPEDKSVNIIDIACGAGHFLYFLQKENYTNTYGIDLSEEQLDVARKMGINNLKKVDLFEYLPKYHQSYDMIIANDIIEHLYKDEIMQFLELIYQALKPRGRVLIATANASSLFGASAVFVDFTHEQGFTPISLSQVLRICNFKDVEIYGERPIVYDFRSTIRAGLWWCIRKILNTYVIISYGTGRGMWKHYNIFEPRIFAVGKKL